MHRTHSKSDQSGSCCFPEHLHPFCLRHVHSATNHASIRVTNALHFRLDVVERHTRISESLSARLCIPAWMKIYSHSQNTTSGTRHQSRRCPTHLFWPRYLQSISDLIERCKSHRRISTLFTQHRRQSFPQAQYAFSLHHLRDDSRK